MDTIKNIGKQLVVLMIVTLTSMSCAQKRITSIKKVNGTFIQTDRLDKEILRIMDSIEMAGVSVAIINDSELVYHRTFGYTNLATKEELTKEHIFEGASLSKPIFAYFAMKMVDKGVLDLDKPLYQYMEHPAIDDTSREDYKTITARMVLSHSSGFPNFSEGKKVVLPFKPGENYLYSGEGYQYLAAIIGKLNGVGWREKFNEIFKDEVTVPLGMKHTSFLWNDYLAKNKVYGHKNGQPTHNDSGGWSGKTFNAFSSIHSEAFEYSRFIIAMLKREGLTNERFNEMLKQENTFETANELFQETGQTGWGLGFAQKPTPNGLMHLHTGNNHSFQAYAMFVPQQQYGLVLFSNSDKMLAFIEQLGIILEEQF